MKVALALLAAGAAPSGAVMARATTPNEVTLVCAPNLERVVVGGREIAARPTIDEKEFRAVVPDRRTRLSVANERLVPWRCLVSFVYTLQGFGYRRFALTPMSPPKSP